MKKTWMVMSYEIRATLGRKAFTLVAIGLPLLMGLVVLAVIWINRDAASEPQITVEAATDVHQVVGYVDPGGLIQIVPGDIPNASLLPYRDVATAQAALEAGDIDGYYLIPADYLERGELTYFQLEYQPISSSTPDYSPMEWTLLVNLFGGDVAAADAAANPIEVAWQQATPPGATEPVSGDESWIAELLPNLMAFLLYMVIILPAGTLVAAITDEKKNRVVEILLSSVSPGQLIGGKIVALGLLGLLQTALWVAVMWLVVHLGGETLRIPPGFAIPSGLLAWCFVFGLLGYAMYGAQLAGLGALTPDIKDSRGATMVVLSPLIIVYMFLFTIVMRPDSPISVALSFFPLTSPVAMIARMTATTVPIWQPVLAVPLQLLTSILIVRAVARLFRAQVMLSGQPFSLRAYGSALWSRS